MYIYRNTVIPPHSRLMWTGPPRECGKTAIKNLPLRGWRVRVFWYINVKKNHVYPPVYVYIKVKYSTVILYCILNKKNNIIIHIK